MRRTEQYIYRMNDLLHIYNRGNRKEEICKDIKDYVFFNNLLKKNFRDHHFDLVCFCIMPNHYHILGKQKGKPHISFVMQKFGTGYSKYINSKYGLKGHLFQGRYKTRPIRNKDQLKIVIKYILSNWHYEHNTYPWVFKNETLINLYLEDIKEKGTTL